MLRAFALAKGPLNGKREGWGMRGEGRREARIFQQCTHHIGGGCEGQSLGTVLGAGDECGRLGFQPDGIEASGLHLGKSKYCILALSQ